MSRNGLFSLMVLVLLPLGGCAEECSCVAPQPIVLGVDVTGAPTVPIRVGNRVLLTAKIQATGYLYDTRVFWRTLSPLVLEVDETGSATAIGTGVGTIEAIARVDTTRRGTTTIRVE